MADPHRREFMRELCRDHVSGTLKVAPEHVSKKVLYYMRKPEPEVFDRFAAEYRLMNEELGKKQYLIPYFISSHPGSTLDAAVELALYLKKFGFIPDQTQDFYPTPGTLATCMYYAEKDPFTGKPSQNGVISITVLVPLSQENAGALADAYSTAGFCMPLTQALEFYRSLWEEEGIGAVVITSDFCYDVVGGYTVLQPKEYAALTRPELEDSVENVFSLREGEAQDEVVPCQKEREYISLFSQE